jgi:hypothetical protein
MTMAIVGVTQLGPVMMAARALDQGWSRRWGSKVHASVYASNLSMDFTSLSACTVIGALLLARHYGSVEVVKPLAILAMAICFLPDVRICRFLLSGDPVEASRQLRKGSILRDPVMLGAILATGVACAVDRVSLNYFLGVAGLPAVQRAARARGQVPAGDRVHVQGGLEGAPVRSGRSPSLADLAPLALLPLAGLGDGVAWCCAGLIVVRSRCRTSIASLSWCRPSALFKVTPSQPGDLHRPAEVTSGKVAAE